MVELTNRNVIEENEVVGPVKAHVNTTIRTEVNLGRVGRIDPDRMIVAVHPSAGVGRVGPGTSSIVGKTHGEGRAINPLGISRIDGNGRKIEGSGFHIEVRTLLLPRLTGICREVQARLLRFYDGKEIRGRAGSQCQCYASDLTGRQTLGQLFPGLTAIGTL